MEKQERMTGFKRKKKLINENYEKFWKNVGGNR